MFAEVAFPISNFKTFTYEIPKNLIAETHIGSRVVAPFRKQQIEGIIVNILKRSSFKGETKFWFHYFNCCLNQILTVPIL